MLSDEQIAEIEAKARIAWNANTKAFMGERPMNDDEHFAICYSLDDIAKLLSDRKEYIAELEKLNAENHNLKYDNGEVGKPDADIELLKEELAKALGFTGYWKSILFAERDRLQAENDAIKKAIRDDCYYCKHSGARLRTERAPCLCAPACEDDVFEFDFDRFKEGELEI